MNSRGSSSTDDTKGPTINTYVPARLQAKSFTPHGVQVPHASLDCPVDVACHATPVQVARLRLGLFIAYEAIPRPGVER